MEALEPRRRPEWPEPELPGQGGRGRGERGAREKITPLDKALSRAVGSMHGSRAQLSVLLYHLRQGSMPVRCR